MTTIYAPMIVVMEAEDASTLLSAVTMAIPVRLIRATTDFACTVEHVARVARIAMIAMTVRMIFAAMASVSIRQLIAMTVIPAPLISASMGGASIWRFAARLTQTAMTVSLAPRMSALMGLVNGQRLTAMTTIRVRLTPAITERA
jgi:hypothetical protein